MFFSTLIFKYDQVGLSWGRLKLNGSCRISTQLTNLITKKWNHASCEYRSALSCYTLVSLLTSNSSQSHHETCQMWHIACDSRDLPLPAKDLSKSVQPFPDFTGKKNFDESLAWHPKKDNHQRHQLNGCLSQTSSTDNWYWWTLVGYQFWHHKTQTSS